MIDVAVNVVTAECRPAANTWVLVVDLRELVDFGLQATEVLQVVTQRLSKLVADEVKTVVRAWVVTRTVT